MGNAAQRNAGGSDVKFISEDWMPLVGGNRFEIEIQLSNALSFQLQSIKRERLASTGSFVEQLH
jgi:hypothetical protein